MHELKESEIRKRRGAGCSWPRSYQRDQEGIDAERQVRWQGSH